MGGLDRVSAPEVLFAKLEDELVAELRERYSGSQRERAERKSAAEPAAAKADAAAVPPAPAPKPAPEPKVAPFAELPVEERFEKLIDLRVAKIVRIERHPKADKLYIETLDDGSGIERVIVSGLVPFYKEEELLGKSIVLVHNLKPAKLRGVESRGMLLAASRRAVGEDGASVKEAVEVLDAGDVPPGTRLCLEGRSPPPAELPEIDADAFFSVPIAAAEGFAVVGSSRLVASGKPFALLRVPEGEVG
jgi:methionyl-tRNA synthetase